MKLTVSEGPPNRISGWQETTVHGAKALRYLLFSLGFDAPRGRMKGERRIPPIEEILKELGVYVDPRSDRTH